MNETWSRNVIGFDDLTRAFGLDTSRGGKGLGLEVVVWTDTAKGQV